MDLEDPKIIALRKSMSVRMRFGDIHRLLMDIIDSDALTKPERDEVCAMVRRIVNIHTQLYERDIRR